MNSNPYWSGSQPTSSSTASFRRSGSERSYHSQSTAPTEHHDRPAARHYETCYGRLEGHRNFECEVPTDEYDVDYYDDPRTSVETYASTIPSEDEPDIAHDACPDFEVPEQHPEPFPIDALPATPRDFAELFPSSRRLLIRHDDSTIDGNKNLRIDTQVDTMSGRVQNLTLFHLRMHDLKDREFSLRRYCRDSGREVCHSVGKHHKAAAEKRPGLQRSLSSALATLLNKPDSKSSSSPGIKRSDSGYNSMNGEEDSEASIKPVTLRKGHPQTPTNTIKLEFSNYAHVEVKRQGAKSNKRYEFEYWGTNYAWRRVVKLDGHHEQASFHLTRSDSEAALAHIVPAALTRAQLQDEAVKGGWIPPCSMWISDRRIIGGLTDISDVVVASGLIALVDDCIRRRFHSEKSTQLMIPLSRNSSFKMEYIGPKRLIDEVFNRATSSRRPTLPRRTSHRT
ncbi:hypothetical protein W97_05385 [Coniosporium apollinis CBS 100218]|uniref:Uncharacterized protein n=1 Tax=Coniosporium apollinis (strain CBS 100218) TaxID=1168221 RepID=R7YW75_CONA1|nr:uncharacterized protein W97_05385 [Coniosporium apollinis CBS 100218]EON66142.1 hypothetical protein W97_05385 [Coniosporium apollinis CBS 100218]